MVDALAMHMPCIWPKEIADALGDYDTAQAAQEYLEERCCGLWFHPCGAVPVIPASADRSEGYFVFVLHNLVFWDLFAPGIPNMFKMMPRGVGPISTPADFLRFFFFNFET